jgi:Domain of unknown function (DUF4124)
LKSILFAVLLAAALPAQAQMYKCVDERGVTHYSDNPGTGCKGKAVDIRPIPPVSGKIQGSSPDVARDNADFNRRQIERERAEVKEAGAREAQKELCAELRSDKGLLISGRRIITGYSDKGERVYMDDEARNKRLAELNQQLRACP